MRCDKTKTQFIHSWFIIKVRIQIMISDYLKHETTVLHLFQCYLVFFFNITFQRSQKEFFIFLMLKHRNINIGRTFHIFIFIQIQILMEWISASNGHWDNVKRLAAKQVCKSYILTRLCQLINSDYYSKNIIFFFFK